jgi:hypothetical protein
MRPTAIASIDPRPDAFHHSLNEEVVATRRHRLVIGGLAAVVAVHAYFVDSTVDAKAAEVKVRKPL